MLVDAPTEAVVVVRETEYRRVQEVLTQLVSAAGGVRLAFSIVQIPESEDWGTADSLRSLRGKLRVGVGQPCSHGNTCIYFVMYTLYVHVLMRYEKECCIGSLIVLGPIIQ